MKQNLRQPTTVVCWAIIAFASIGTAANRIADDGNAARQQHVIAKDGTHNLDKISNWANYDKPYDKTIFHKDEVEKSGKNEEEEDPLLYAGYFEGDIVRSNVDELSSRNAINDDEKLWPDGQIPYELPLLEFSIVDQKMIKFAMKGFEEQTCIRFTPRKSETDYIRFIRGAGCYSNVGRIGGKQDVSVGKGCVSKGIIMHELNHAVGFWHEQSRPDRDDYVTIKWDNIKKGTEANFAKYPLTLVQNLNEKYDFNSLMHYGPYSFTKNKHRKTIEAKVSVPGLKMGQRIGFTTLDVTKINKLYNCSNELRKSKQPVREKNFAVDIISEVTEFLQNLVSSLQLTQE